MCVTHETASPVFLCETEHGFLPLPFLLLLLLLLLLLSLLTFLCRLPHKKVSVRAWRTQKGPTSLGRAQRRRALPLFSCFSLLLSMKGCLPSCLPQKATSLPPSPQCFPHGSKDGSGWFFFASKGHELAISIHMAISTHSHLERLHKLCLPACLYDYPTTNAGMQNGSSVGICTCCIHIFARLASTCMLSPVRINKISASELSRKFIKGALLVGYKHKRKKKPKQAVLVTRGAPTYPGTSLTNNGI